MDKKELKPCPFCGEEAELEDWTCAWESGTTIGCVGCNARIVEGVVDGDGWHDRAVEKWNRRTAAHARIAELEVKLESKEMGYSALQESYVNSVMDIGRLQLRYNEAMELLEAAVADAEYLAYLVKNAGGKCDNCHKSDKSCTQSSDCWRWQHADRYDALRVQDETADPKLETIGEQTMLFPIIRVADNDSDGNEIHVVGTNSHDILEIDKKTGGIQYLNLQCSEGTTVYDGHSTFSFQGIENEWLGACVEMVSFERLCEIYLEQTKQSAEQEAKSREFIKTIHAKYDKIIHANGLDSDDGIRHTGGTLL